MTDHVERKLYEDLLRIENWTGVVQLAESQPTTAFSCYMRGVGLTGLGSLEEAQKSYLECINLDDKFAEAFGNLGCLAHERGEYELALEWHKRALKVKPELVNSWDSIALTCIDLERFDGARAAFREGCKLPNAASHSIQRSYLQLLLDEGHYDEAEKQFSERVKPSNPPNLRLIEEAMDFMRQRRVAKAFVGAMSAAAQRDRDNPESDLENDEGRRVYRWSMEQHEEQHDEPKKSGCMAIVIISILLPSLFTGVWIGHMSKSQENEGRKTPTTAPIIR